jgi:hypothetical protein
VRPWKTVVQLNHRQLFSKNKRKAIEVAKKVAKIADPLWTKALDLAKKGTKTMAARTRKPSEFLTISILDEPQVELLRISLNRPTTELLGAMFVLWVTAVEAQAHENEWVLGMSWQEVDQLVGIPGFCDAMIAVKWMKKFVVSGVSLVQISKMNLPKKPPKKKQPIEPTYEQLTVEEHLCEDRQSTPMSPLLAPPCSSSLSPSFLSPTTPLYTPPHSSPSPSTLFPPFNPTPTVGVNEIAKTPISDISIPEVSKKSGQKSSCFAFPQNGVISIKKSFSELYPEIDKALGYGDERHEELKKHAGNLGWLFVNQYKGYGLYNRYNFFKANVGTIFEILRLRVSPVALKYEILDDTRDKSEPVFKLADRAKKFMIDPKFNSYNDVELDYIYHYGDLEDSEDPNGWVSGLEKELERHLGVQNQCKTFSKSV